MEETALFIDTVFMIERNETREKRDLIGSKSVRTMQDEKSDKSINLSKKKRFSKYRNDQRILMHTISRFEHDMLKHHGVALTDVT